MADSKAIPRQAEVILVLNAGATFLEFQLFRMAREQRMLAKGQVEAIGADMAQLTYERYDGRELRERAPVRALVDALRLVCEVLTSRGVGVIESLAELDAVGHRVVHGGERFQQSAPVSAEVKDSIRACVPLAPLHNPANLLGIEACETALPGVPCVAVFDTAFHHSMPASSYLYALPNYLYTTYGVRKYGFHGCSHQYAAEAACAELNLAPAAARLITCHLGKGCSATAIAGGKVLDTSMGMTPLPGLIMTTRCGDIDPAVLLFLAEQGMSAAAMDELLNQKSGLLGIAGIGSGDMRHVIDAAEHGNEQAAHALASFIHRVVAYIGSYYTLLGGADAVVFTGGIGENSPAIRARIVSQLGVLGCHLDNSRNHVIRRTAVISDDRSTLRAVVIPSNEELMIARETVRVLGAA